METVNLLNTILEDSKKNRILLSVYEDKNDVEKFYVGYVVNVYSDTLLLFSLDEYGINDGYLLVRMEDIYKIEQNTSYLEKLTILANNEYNYFLKLDGEQGIAETMSFCKEKQILVTIKLIFDDIIIGYVSEEDDERYLIKNVSKEGIMNGVCLIEYKDIQNVHFDGKEEKNILKLMNTNLR
jgi:hypothetical protein